MLERLFSQMNRGGARRCAASSLLLAFVWLSFFGELTHHHGSFKTPGASQTNIRAHAGGKASSRVIASATPKSEDADRCAYCEWKLTPVVIASSSSASAPAILLLPIAPCEPDYFSGSLIAVIPSGRAPPRV